MYMHFFVGFMFSESEDLEFDLLTPLLYACHSADVFHCLSHWFHILIDFGI